MNETPTHDDRGAARRKQYLLCLLCLFLLSLSGCTDESVTVKPPDAPTCADVPSVRHGEATFYTFADGGGNCMFDPTPNDLMVGAMNQIDYAGSRICGACVQVIGPKGDTIRIRIVDRCPECPQGNVDLSPLAFSKIADTSLGRVPISWQLIGRDVQGPIVYHFKWEYLRLRAIPTLPAVAISQKFHRSVAVSFGSTRPSTPRSGVTSKS